jgi:hypothetical protein
MQINAQAVKLASAMQSCEGRVIGVRAYISFPIMSIEYPSPALYYTSSVSVVFIETF